MSARRFGAGLAGAAALIATITLLSRALGFGRWMAQSAAVGQTCVGTAYATANQLPNVLFEVVAGGALAAAVVPVLAGPLARGGHGRAEVDRISSALLTWAVVVLVPVAALLAAVAGPATRWLLAADDGDACAGQTALAVRMLLVFAPQVVLYGIGIVLTGVLQAQRKFLWPAAAPLASSLVVILAYGVFHSLADDRQDDPAALPGSAEAWLAWGTTAGVAVMTLPLLLPVLRSGVRLRPTLRFPAGVARRVSILAGAGVVTLLAQQVSVVTVLRLANDVVGAVNVFQYAQAVYLLPYAVLAVPLATSAFPRLAERAATGDRDGFASTASTTTRAVVLIGLLGTVVLVAVAGPVEAFFAAIDQSGEAPWMGPALVAMAPGLVGFALVAHLGRALNALERGRLAAAAASTGWLVVSGTSIVAVTLLDRERTVVGLGVGSSVGMVVAGLLLVLATRYAAGPASTAGVLRTALGAGAAAALACVVGWWVGQRLVDGDGAAAAVGSGAVAAAVALVVLAAGTALLDRESVTAARRLLGRGRTR